MNFLKRVFLKSIIYSIIISLLVFNHMKSFIRVFNSYYMMCSLKALCFSLLIYTSVLVTFDYFSYPYVFKLNVNNNINGFDLPPISFCTETNVLFDKNKFISFFNSSQEFRDFRTKEVENYEKEIKQNLIDYQLNSDPNTWEDQSFWFLVLPQYPYPRETFDKRKGFYKELSFDQMKDLMIRSHQMINCSAKLHSRYHSKRISFENLKDFNVLESIYGNKDFGICFTFFHSNERFYIKDNDYIEFEFSYENGPDLMRNSYFEFNMIGFRRYLDENVVFLCNGSSKS